MKFIDEYRDRTTIKKYLMAIDHITTQPWTIMEVCGGQTHAILKFGLDKLLPHSITLLHGPGCPVCVTPIALIDKAITLAATPNVILCSFGDMLRVPGSRQDLLAIKAQGGNIRIVYSPLDALKLAQKNPSQEVVFFAVGFETTAPANAMAVYQAARQEIKNFSLLVSQVLVPPAMATLLTTPDQQISAFLAAGHVCTVMGYQEYEPLAAKYHIPIVVTGFQPLDILQGIYMCVKQLESGDAMVENQYTRAVSHTGNLAAQQLIHTVFEVVPREWRGIGEIPASGLGLRAEYRNFDAENRFSFSHCSTATTSECISGLILQGIKKPDQCPAFAKRCTPENPLGATMVSSEGACAAYYLYRE